MDSDDAIVADITFGQAQIAVNAALKHNGILVAHGEEGCAYTVDVDGRQAVQAVYNRRTNTLTWREAHTDKRQDALIKAHASINPV